MARAVSGPQARVMSVRRLTGGIDASTHLVRVEPGGAVVLKRSWTTDPASLAGEFERLGWAAPARVPTPVPIRLDAAGDWFGRPAMVMGAVAGRAVFHGEVGPWVDELAAALAAIHATPLPSPLPPVLRAPHAGLVWQPSEGAHRSSPARVRALMGSARSLQAGLRRADGHADVLLHHDFHHGNVLWRRGRLSGVLDWNEATTGPAASDVAYCSVDLAMTHGRRAADRFCAAYRVASGRDLPDLTGWQSLWTLNAMRWAALWARGFHDAGIIHLGLPLLRDRLRRFADAVIATV